MVCDEGYEIRGRLGGVGAKLECKEDGSWESPVSSKHSKQFPFCKGKHLRYDYMKTDSHLYCLLIPFILFSKQQIFYFLFIEKSCSHPDITSPTIANGTLEINGKRQGGLQVSSTFDKSYK